MGVKIQELILKSKLILAQLQRKVIAVDAPNINGNNFSLLNFSYKNQRFDLSNLMTDRTQRAISHLYGLLFRINFYYHNQLLPIFCFDGRDFQSPLLSSLGIPINTEF